MNHRLDRFERKDYLPNENIEIITTIEINENLPAVAVEYIRESRRPNWTVIAHDLGYSPQQHFIADFEQVLGKRRGNIKREITSP
jgi:hypothetical protein